VAGDVARAFKVVLEQRQYDAVLPATSLPLILLSWISRCESRVLLSLPAELNAMPSCAPMLRSRSCNAAVQSAPKRCVKRSRSGMSCFSDVSSR
jgi:hypothetical protein